MGWIEDTAARLLPTSATPRLTQPGCPNAPAPEQDVGKRILGSEELNDVESQGLAVASERTAIRS